MSWWPLGGRRRRDPDRILIGNSWNRGRQWRDHWRRDSCCFRPNYDRKRHDFARQCRRPTALTSRFPVNADRKFACDLARLCSMFALSRSLHCWHRPWPDVASDYTPAGVEGAENESERSRMVAHESRGVNHTGEQFPIYILSIYQNCSYLIKSFQFNQNHFCSSYDYNCYKLQQL